VLDEDLHLDRFRSDLALFHLLALR
jgi:hypothetical protein